MDPVAPNPTQIFERAQQEGRRRLSMSWLDMVSTAFIAGITVVFGLVALAVTEALVEPSLGEGPAKVAGGLAFAIGLVFLVVGRTELFSEDLFDPVAAAVGGGERHPLTALLRLWGVTLALNLVGGALLLAILLVDGALPDGAAPVLDSAAEEIAGKGPLATLARAVLAGALLALLSYMLNAVDTVSARILVTTMVGFFLALGPFDHAVVSGLHLLFGIWNGAAVDHSDLLANLGLATVGNLVGGLLLVTFTHTAQVRGE